MSYGWEQTGVGRSVTIGDPAEGEPGVNLTGMIVVGSGSTSLALRREPFDGYVYSIMTYETDGILFAWEYPAKLLPAETPKPEETEYIVLLEPQIHRYHGLSVHQCTECCALVVEDYMPSHMAWHQQLGRNTGFVQ